MPHNLLSPLIVAANSSRPPLVIIEYLSGNIRDFFRIYWIPEQGRGELNCEMWLQSAYSVQINIIKSLRLLFNPFVDILVINLGKVVLFKSHRKIKPPAN